MKIFKPLTNVLLTLILLLTFNSKTATAQPFAWQEDQATVTETGAIVWKPKPFKDDLSGQEVRYIDYENGDDANDGLTKDSPWKHHPWDYQASGKAKNSSGVKTYVFKRGVLYRGQLFAKESGTRQQPIRLTSTAAWSEGEAIFVGSVKLPAEWIKVTDEKIDSPERLAEPEKVWALDLAKMEWWNNGKPGYIAGAINNHSKGRRSIQPPFIGLFTMKKNGTSKTNYLAQEPNWQPSGNEFAHDYWPAFDGNSKPFEDAKDNELLKYGAQDEDLKGYPQDYFTGAIVWKTYPSFMGGATPTKPLPQQYTDKKSSRSVNFYNPEEGALAMTNIQGFSKGTRYKIENLPQYLDTAAEFYLDKNILFYRPPAGHTPNEMHLELTINEGNIIVEDQSHIEISGLGFRFTDGSAIELRGSCQSVTIKNCIFRNLMRNAISNSLRPDQVLWSEYYDPAEWKLDWMDDIEVADNQLYNIWDMAIRFYDARSRQNWVGRKFESWPWGKLGNVKILRNKLEDLGIRHQGSPYSPIPAISLVRAETGMVAGNIIKGSFGSGIMVQGGRSEGMKDSEIPLCRILVFHNSTEDTALGVNDYGGFSLWQSGMVYIYNNSIGNSTGHMPGGMFGRGVPRNLSYPYYVDGGFKIVGFNNVIWDYSIDPADPFRSSTAGYFSVFGFLNHFTNNTLLRHGRAMGGSSGNRTDIISNVFAEISDEFLKNNRIENPSLVGGGDTGASGILGVPSLAYGRNFFHGPAEAGELVSGNEKNRVQVPHDIKANTIAEMSEQMQDFPVRYGQLGRQLDENPLVGELKPHGLREEGAKGADFRLTRNSPAIDNGATYFMPWALARNVGEWNFTENNADPTQVLDYSFYMREVHFDRFMYSWVPYNSLQFNHARLEDYVPAPSEDWVNGALNFDGTRFGSVSDQAMREDIEMLISQYITGKGQRTWSKWQSIKGKDQWTIPEPEGGYNEKGIPQYSDDQAMRYPGEKRKTLISKTENLLLEVKFKTAADFTSGYLITKHDGKNGYSLFVNDKGQAQFRISADGKNYNVQTQSGVNDGEWHHVIAEIDRKTGRMKLYLDGHSDDEMITSLASETSIDNQADFIVGKSSAEEKGYFQGAIDFMRVCHGTLADAKTTIEELYAWQFTDGPFMFDMRGKPVRGARRDAGALELQ